MGMYFVYILQSFKSGRFYVGHCDHFIRRFYEHQQGLNRSTKNRGPWCIPYFETYLTRSDAMVRETFLKRKKSSKYIDWLIKSKSIEGF